MKRLALSVFSAALFFGAIAPLAQAAPSPAQASVQSSTSSFTLSQSVAQRSLETLEERRQDELDRNGDPGGSLNRPRPAAPADVERPQRSPSALEQRRLDELDRRNSPRRSAPTDVERAGNVQMSRLQQRRLSHLNKQ